MGAESQARRDGLSREDREHARSLGREMADWTPMALADLAQAVAQAPAAGDARTEKSGAA